MINRASRQGEENARAARDHLVDLGVDVVLGRYQKPDDLAEAIDAHSDSIDTVVLGGGDGTLNLAAGALMRSKLRLGVLPLGTANDFARTLCIPSDLENACRTVVEGVDHGVDLGQCNEIYFVNVASIGLSARARKYRSDAAKRWFGALGYASNVFSAFRDTRPFTVEVQHDGQHHKLRSIQVAIGNGRYFGGGLAVTSNAALDDGTLNLYSLQPQGTWGMILKIPTFVRGPDKSIEGVELFESAEFRVTTKRPMPINTDGEILTKTPAVFRVLAKALTVRVPQVYLDNRARERTGA